MTYELATNETRTQKAACHTLNSFSNCYHLDRRLCTWNNHQTPHKSQKKDRNQNISVQTRFSGFSARINHLRKIISSSIKAKAVALNRKVYVDNDTLSYWLVPEDSQVWNPWFDGEIAGNSKKTLRLDTVYSHSASKIFFGSFYGYWKDEIFANKSRQENVNGRNVVSKENI